MSNSKPFVWASASLCVRDRSCQLVCERVFIRARDIDRFLSALKSGGWGSPAAWQIGTPDLCLCHPLISPPRRTIIPPLPTCADRWRLHRGVLDLCCTVGRRGTGSDRIRPDSLCACVCLRAGKIYRYQRGFFGDFLFFRQRVQWISPHLIWCPNIFKHVGFKRSIFSCRKLEHGWKISPGLILNLFSRCESTISSANLSISSAY